MEWNTATFWVILAFLFGLFEVLTGTFVLLFFAVGALLVAAASFLGLHHAATQIVLFALFSLLGLLFLRKKILGSMDSHKAFHGDKNQILVLSNDLPAKANARISYQGTQWTVENTSDQSLTKGQKVEITGTKGNQLLVRPLMEKK